jgi:hypothetical protein
MPPRETAIFHVLVTLEQDPAEFLAFEVVRRSVFRTVRLGVRVPRVGAKTAYFKNNRRS